MVQFFLIIGFLFFSTGCFDGVPDKKVLFDFESDTDLDRINWRCHTLFSLSDEYVTHGTRSLRMELYPSDYPGFSPILNSHNWCEYSSLYLDIFNPDNSNVSIVLRIDDKEMSPEYADRYNKRFQLNSGMNHLKISLNTLLTSGTHRPLSLKNIVRFTLFKVRPKEKYIFYMDHIYLSM